MTSKKGNISTRTGDKGTTLTGGGDRVSKNDLRMHCLGDLDEADCWLGMIRTRIPADHDWQEPLQEIQTELMNLMGHVATPSTAGRTSSTPLPLDGAKRMEIWMAEIEASLASTTEHFLLPGGTVVAAHCQVARTVVRRAERSLVALNEADPIDPIILVYLNRLSDLLFKLTRQELHRSGTLEERWRLFKPDRDPE